MKSNDMITKIKEVLNLTQEVTLEQMKLENGTILEADSFESGEEVFILTEDEKVALPVGEYQLEDGRSLIIEEVGLIAEIKAEEEKEEEEKEEEEKEAKEEKEEMKYATKEELAEVKEMIEEIKAMLDPKDKEKEEMSADDLGNLLTEELSKQEIPDEVQIELNKPAAEPIKSNPEAVRKNIDGYVFGANRVKSTADRVMERILKINN